MALQESVLSISMGMIRLDGPGQYMCIVIHTYIHTVTWEEMLSAMAHGLLPDIAGMLFIGIYASWCCRLRNEEVRWWWHMYSTYPVSCTEYLRTYASTYCRYMYLLRSV